MTDPATTGRPGPEPRRVVVVGATGNLGTEVVRALAADPRVGPVTGIARRPPRWSLPGVTWVGADIGGDADLARHVAGADAVIHLAWLFQPTRDPLTTWRTNVLGAIKVFDAVAAAGVPALVHASSVGAYSPGPKDRAVDESWPTHGWPGAAYCREKSYLERCLDSYAVRHPGVRVVRIRPGFLFKEEASTEQRRLFAGPLLPRRLAAPGLLPLVPDLTGLRFQALHTADAADAFVRAALQPVEGAFNIAADPVVDARTLGGLFGARPVRLPVPPLRSALAAAWRLHLLPASPQLFDAVLRLPLMDTGRARRELGWRPEHSALDALQAFIDGLRSGAGLPTPPLAPDRPGGRLAELATGIGRRP